MSEIPTVGRIVHFYREDLGDAFAKNGVGPYAAIVTSVHKDNSVDLHVFADGHSADWSKITGHGRLSESVEMWWEWPPKV